MDTPAIDARPIALEDAVGYLPLSGGKIADATASPFRHVISDSCAFQSENSAIGKAPTFVTSHVVDNGGICHGEHTTIIEATTMDGSVVAFNGGTNDIRNATADTEATATFNSGVAADCAIGHGERARATKTEAASIPTSGVIGNC